MSNTFFTVTGLHHYYGDSFLEKEMIVYLKKEKDNEYDKEAISVNLPVNITDGQAHPIR